MPSEAEFKRALVRQLLNEGGFGRRNPQGSASPQGAANTTSH